MPPHSFRLEKSSGFCHPASIPTRPSFLGCHNWRQISGVLDGQMALYGIAGTVRSRVDARRDECYKEHFKAANLPAPRGSGSEATEKFRRNNSMPSIGHQLGELFLGAAPTVLIILLFYFIFPTLFFQPLLKVMAERDARTIGA